MRAIGFGAAILVVVVSGNFVSAQPPVWAGGPTPPGDLFGYSPFVPTVESFPSKTSGYALFGPNAGRRVWPPLVVNPRRSERTYIIEMRDGPRVPTGKNLASTAPVTTAPVVTVAAFEPVGPVLRPLPATGLHRFDR